MGNERINLRNKFNNLVRTSGNNVRQGIGDILTKRIDLAPALASIGGISLPLTYAHFMCKEMYESGVVGRMYSADFVERTIGLGESAGYTLTWWIALPTTAFIGSDILEYIGKRLNRI